MKSKLIIIGAGVFGVYLVYSIFTGEDSAPSATQQPTEPPVSFDPNYGLGAESDQSIDTLRTLTRQVELSRQESDALRAQIAKQDEELRLMRQEMAKPETKDDSVAARVIRDDLSKQILNLRTNLEDQIDSLRGERRAREVVPEQGSVDDIESTDTPPLLLLPGQVPAVLGQPESDNPPTQPVKRAEPEIKFWVEPSDVIIEIDERGRETKVYPELGQDLPETEEEVSASTSTSAAIQPEKPEPVPFATIPQNSTLVDAVSMTSLVGRIPLDGKVEDPFRFKVLVGKDNLATNGLTIDGLESIVMSGVAIGDFTLRCTRGSIDSMTFTFADGRIRTVTNSDIPESEQGLGYISDEYGVPCVEGKYLSNLKDYIAVRGGMEALSVAAGAVADAQSTVYQEGANTTTVVTGDTGLYAAGEGIREGVNTVGGYLDARQASAFDAVFVESGTKVAVHIEAQIEIDYLPDGRLLNYASFDRGVYETALD